MIPESLAIFDSLRESNSIEAQIVALRTVKNHITGHELRKVDYLKAGIIPLLSEVLRNAQHSSNLDESSAILHDQVWLQVTNVVGAIAIGEYAILLSNSKRLTVKSWPFICPAAFAQSHCYTASDTIVLRTSVEASTRYIAMPQLDRR